jgi:Cu(I)/Ag(I) efflux system membrane fusion protein
VHDGQEAEIAVPASPGRTYRARIRLLSPLVDPATRTVSARLEVPNPDLALKPGMFTEVTLASNLGVRRSIPKDAVIRTGTRDVVFVTTDDRTFAPVEVRLGVELPDRWEIVSGLTGGERVLVGANFLIDSESKLRSAQGDRP